MSLRSIATCSKQQVSVSSQRKKVNLVRALQPCSESLRQSRSNVFWRFGYFSAGDYRPKRRLEVKVCT
jgi:hypothetical protein